MTSSGSKLQVGVIGAGIAGLSAAIALSRAGHDVAIYERSLFKNETGAAIIVSPNANLVLDRWQFDFTAAGAVDNRQVRRIKADTLEVDSVELLGNIEEKYGNRWTFFHRADLHNGLRKLVEHPIDPSKPKATINLSSDVVQIDCQRGTLTLANGPVIQKDLLVVADGAHCRHIPAVTGKDTPITKTPMSMYRFLVPMKDLAHDERTKDFYEGEVSGVLAFYKSAPGMPGLLLNTYPCRNGDLMYCALLHPTKPAEKNLEDWNQPATVDEVLDTAKAFHPRIQAICEKAADVKVYTQMFRVSIETFVNGKAALVGDSAHFMFPTHGQGASSSMEDAAALEVLFSGATNKDVTQRLELFQKLRHPRATAIQSLSNFMMAGPEKMHAEARKYYDGPLPAAGAKTFSEPFCDFFFRYNIFEESEKVIASAGHANAGLV